MSYDLRIWCVRALGDAETGVLESGDGWLVNASSSRPVLDDLPFGVTERLPGVRYVVDLSLEPVSASQAGFDAARKVARAIAKTATGVIEDPQSGLFDVAVSAAQLKTNGAGIAPAILPKTKRKRMTAGELLAKLRSNPEHMRREEESRQRDAQAIREQEPIARVCAAQDTTSLRLQGCTQ